LKGDGKNDLPLKIAQAVSVTFIEARADAILIHHAIIQIFRVGYWRT
jgi:hypothetical protein